MYKACVLRDVLRFFNKVLHQLLWKNVFNELYSIHV
jgi:hypothetical protein